MPVNCPNILSSGTCPNGSSCTYNHTILACEPCGFIAVSQYAYDSHLNGKKHRSRTNPGQSPPQSFHCSICTKNIDSTSWTVHVGGKKHCSKARTRGVDPNIAPVEGISNETETYCSLCQYASPVNAWEQHIAGRWHRRREAFMRYRSVLDEAEKDKNGVTVEGVTDIGFLDPVRMPLNWEGHTSTLVAKSLDKTGAIVMTKVELASSQGSRRLHSGFTITSARLERITPSAPAVVTFRFNGRSIGRYEDRIEFTFEDMSHKKRFVITRQLQVIVGNEADHEALKPTAPYADPRLSKRDRAARREPEADVVPGVPPPAVNAVDYVLPLARADIPKHLSGLLGRSDGSIPLRQQIDDVQRLFLPPALNTGTYARHFKNLLWVEEYRTEADLQRYDMSDVVLTKHNHYYFLAIPGLAEKRPSVLVGDRILFQKRTATPSKQWYEGHVHVVRQSEVGLCFHTSFTTSGWSPTQKYDVRFKLNRIVLRRQHQALDSAFTQERMFFPEPEHATGSDAASNGLRPRVRFFNPLIGGNLRQAEAVREIVNLKPGSVPFVVFGPPGTGKTVTIVEAIRQLLRTNSSVRILACAPSNSAADLIAQRLTDALSPAEMLRMYAPSRPKQSVPDNLDPYTYRAPPNQTQYAQRECFGVPPLRDLKKFKVIVSTCIAASMLSGVGMPRGHFNWLFVDEAGQATEPEVCVPLKTLADTKMNVVLSGDPKQLGPIVRSAVARALGLEKSWLERLMEREDVYAVPLAGSDAPAANPGAPKVVVKLTQNFRSHPAILRFPNERFYGGDLVACGAIADTHAYLNSPLLPRAAAAKFPVVFHAVVGKDDREASSPSFFNVDEVLQVKAYVQQLKDARRKFRTTDGDIGVIAPYHAQCLKLRTALRSVADSVKVGSVEEFQGQERKVILISTVRSSKDFVDFDLRHTLGFVANPRRFNVAVTRAKALLIIVGNPHVLGLDPLWRSFLNYIHANGGWTGSPDIPWDPRQDDDAPGAEGYGARVKREAQMDMDELARRVQEASLDASGEEDVNIDRPWREVE